MASEMRSRGLSQADVARECDVGPDVVSRWFEAKPPRKRSTPGRSTAAHLERLYGIPVSAWDESTEPADPEQGAA